MILTRDKWTKADVIPFQEYLLSFSKGKEKGQWEQRILNTQMPCIAVPSPDSKRITREIAKGNLLSFLDLWMWHNFTTSAINGGLICKIKDFTLFKKYLLNYVERIDNWASCDLLKFKISEQNKQMFWSLAQEFISSPKTFVRRTGMMILFQFAQKGEYIDEIFAVLNTFKGESEYYVNMVNAWLISECFIRHRKKTLQFLDNHNLNKFTINKTISKCRDSFRVSAEDKEMLLRYRKK